MSNRMLTGALVLLYVALVLLVTVVLVELLEGVN